jgi:GNAT superfamily N-acetyltransferase
MTGKVIQGSFLGGQPKLPPPVAVRLPPPIQAKTAARPPGPPTAAFAARRPGPPMPAFAGRPGMVQRHGAGGAFAVEAGPLGLSLGGGRPLPDPVRGKMEAALGANFSDVRVHVGPQAERIGAIAFTVGSDIYFAPGRFQPDTMPGQQLLGHELAHVVQQRAGRVRNPLGSGLAVVQDHALEAEADRLGHRAAAHRVAAQAKMPPGAAQPSAPVRISLPVSAGPASYRLTAGAGGRPVGSVMVHARDKGTVEVTDLHVVEAERGRGVGRLLLASATKTGQQFGKSKVTLAAQDNGSGHLTHWYKGMGFAQVGVNQRGYPEFAAPISRVLAGVAQRRKVRTGEYNGSAPLPSAADVSLRGCPGGWAPSRVAQLAYGTRSQSRNNPPPAGLQIDFGGTVIDLATYVLGTYGEDFEDSLFNWLGQFAARGVHPNTGQYFATADKQTVTQLCTDFYRLKKPSARSTFGYQNPSHKSRVGLNLLEAGAHTPYDSNKWTTKGDWLTSPSRNFTTYSPNSRNQDPVYTQGHSNVVFGHDTGASVHFNTIGHTQSPHTNQQWNQQPSTFHGLENRDKSNRSGASAPRYQQPSHTLGSHSMYWDSTDPRYDPKYQKPF